MPIMPVCWVLLALVLACHGSASSNPFIGNWTPDGSCIPNSVCCCPSGPMLALPGSSNVTVMLTGNTDGGAGCQGLTKMAGNFTSVSSNTLEFDVINNIQVLAQLLNSLGTTMYMSATGSQCNYTFNRPAPMPPALSAPTAAPSWLNGSVTPQSTGTNVTSGNVTDLDWMMAQAKLLGTYHTDGSCVPSATCCCVVGTVQMSRNPAAAMNMFNATAQLDAGDGCFRVHSIVSSCSATSAAVQFAQGDVQRPAGAAANDSSVTIANCNAAGMPLSVVTLLDGVHKNQLVLINSIFGDATCRTVLLPDTVSTPGPGGPPGKRPLSNDGTSSSHGSQFLLLATLVFAVSVMVLLHDY